MDGGRGAIEPLAEITGGRRLNAAAQEALQRMAGRDDHVAMKNPEADAEDLVRTMAREYVGFRPGQQASGAPARVGAARALSGVRRECRSACHARHLQER